MPTYTYACRECDHTFDEFHSMDDRNKRCEEPCPNCQANELYLQIGAPKLVSDTKSTLTRAGNGWQDVLKKVKKASARNNSIHD